MGESRRVARSRDPSSAMSTYLPLQQQPPPHQQQPQQSTSMALYHNAAMGHGLASAAPSHTDASPPLPPPSGPTDSGVFFSPTSSTCLMCYNAHVDVLLEPCHHQFHARCIEHALAKERICPTCWTPVRTPRRLMMQSPHHQQHHHQQQQQHFVAQMQRGAGPSVDSCQYAVDSKTHVLEHGAVMRKGKWTAEESAYCDRLIEEFKKGNLPLAEGTTLRTFLSKLLHCDPMRISKKYTGDQCIGKIIFRRREDDVAKGDLETIRKELAELEKTYLEREQYNQRRREKRLESELSRDKNRFAAARAIGYAAAAGRSPHAPSQAQVQAGGAAGGYSPGAATHQSMGQHEARALPMQEPLHGGAGYGGPLGRAGGGMLPVPPPLHPPQQPPATSSAASSHGFHGEHSSMAMLGIAGALAHGQGAGHAGPDSRSAGPLAMDSGNASDAFPRVSSIDSFSCLFPRVASVENFQHAASSGFAGLAAGVSFALASETLTTTTTSTSSGFDAQSGGLPKPLSIGESLNAYFPRIQSLEQLSHLLQDHGPHSPRGALIAPVALNPREAMEKASDTSKPQQQQQEQQQHAEERVASGSDRRIAEESGEHDGVEEQQRDGGIKTEPSAYVGREASAESSDAMSSSASSGGSKRLSPSHNASASSGMGNQIQIPKPLNKMPRSSSGIFPRVPSMDKMPRVSSADDKFPRVASLEKLPRIPSMDKLHAVGGGSEQRIPRVPSSDMMARVPSSDMLSRFGSSDHLSSFPSFSNLSALSSSASYDKLSSLGGFKSGFPRNSSIEDILSLVASSESTGLSSNGSTLQLSALAAVAGEESSHLANERKRRLENSQQDTPLTADNKKSKLSA
ncbi:unnamed protein product [Hyaloperonospora brassicae]|uniref:RING-type domain-containing protein n=1 Tax=Hyaloperonospora brassicae TaxID=162125 RepID=A0AAV0TC47_HYABA|nr:unnamed protein product [Hyaloperonospora brassicae]